MLLDNPEELSILFEKTIRKPQKDQEVVDYEFKEHYGVSLVKFENSFHSDIELGESFPESKTEPDGIDLDNQDLNHPLSIDDSYVDSIAEIFTDMIKARQKLPN